MHLGVILPQVEIGPDPDVVGRFATTAEAVGFTSLVLYDHVIGAEISQRTDWMGPYSVESQFHEPFVLFGYLAALTNLELMPGVLILPQRQAVLVAKQAAEVDVLTRGRFRLGVGIGWNPVEYEALGVDFHTRATLYEEQVEVMRRLWTEDVVTHNGPFLTIDRAGILPRPVQRPIPIWMGGGATRPVLERIGRLADGWVCNTLPGHGLEEALVVIRDAAAAAGRDPDAIGLQGIVQPRPGEDPAVALPRQLERWAAVGATHVAVSGLNAGRSPDEHVSFIEEAAHTLLT
ncbi:MAG TPA: LLM class F420-dependent oxidoreductase [Acidimicrobiales bacterium]|nr:LLM class F420-dependent oxidoreductase [Acidimicrobiales bacterium]